MRRRRYKTAVEGPNGWSDWIHPTPRGYLMACCDCGLVHEVQFRVISMARATKTTVQLDFERGGRHGVVFRAKRRNGLTADLRKRERKKP